MHVSGRLQAPLESLVAPEHWALVQPLPDPDADGPVPKQGHLDVLLLTESTLTVVAIRSERIEGYARLGLTAVTHPLRDVRMRVVVSWEELSPQGSFRVTSTDLEVAGDVVARVTYGVSGHAPDRPTDAQAAEFAAALTRRIG